MEQARFSGRRFLLITVLNVTITIFELLGGIVSGSLALISDALHNLSDSFSVILSYIAHRIGMRSPTPKNTYGYQRAEIIAALLNSLILVFLSVYLLIEAIKRIMQPEQVSGGVMFWTALISFVANLFATILLSRDSKHNLNLRATYLHLLSDALASVGVIIGSLLIFFFKISWVDPVVTILVSLYIAYEAWPIIRQTLMILMEGSPAIDPTEVKNTIMTIPSVRGVHHFHTWLINENELVASVHVNLANQSLRETELIYSQIEELLQKKYKIMHVTIQAECTRGLKDKMCFSKDDEKQQH
ncbi:cation diffusion facilitator family transporter [Liquorilactobacillus satsumensis]|uniref:CDF family cation diffusion facilitator n=1 Tax=Liquorilactobacillus satsumensis DSM 16230 = JCM 12392 TaxID=1423801 RepID=A0A0R1V4K8_9LACO|nr:cation diffusion facilitator family transporter [Liquorilactobacillus satsumensis]KRL97813.1 CDF family cation diffusion facilitator [Liquorilactobacillus satsumensis DSM 16230 = JCM 12392]